MKGQLIGQGNTAEVYGWNGKEILKLFRETFPYEGVEKEYRVSKAVEELGLSVPRVGHMIEIEGRNGIIYEKIDGSSMLDVIMKHPFSIGFYSRQLAKLHYQMHQCKVLELLDYKEALEWEIRHTQALDDRLRIFALNILEELPGGNVLCHGDFHPGNVLESGGQPVILDWMTACAGHPAADVARSVMLLRDSVAPVYMPAVMKVIISLLRRRMTNIYLKEYLKLSGLTKKDITRWRIPIIAARLDEWVPEKEKNAIMNELRKAVQAI